MNFTLVLNSLFLNSINLMYFSNSVPSDFVLIFIFFYIKISNDSVNN